MQLVQFCATPLVSRPQRSMVLQGGVYPAALCRDGFQRGASQSHNS